MFARRVLLCALTSTLIGSALVPARAASEAQLPGWIAAANQPQAVMEAITDHRDKTPPEFFSRFRFAFPDGSLGVMVRLQRRNERAVQLVRSSVSDLHWYGRSPSFYGRVHPDELGVLLQSPLVSFVEPDYPISNFLSTAATDVSARSGPGGQGIWSFDPGGSEKGRLFSEVPELTPDQSTGKGVVVAVTDSGIDGTNRDFGGWDCEAAAYEPCDSRILRKVTINSLVGDDNDEAGFPTTDFASGHGTHTAGIIAGNGYYSRTGDADAQTYEGDGYNIGLAPQASLISVKLGDFQSAALGWAALQWQLNHVKEYDIRVSSNSWGCSGGCSFHPQSSGGLILEQLYRAGVLVTFAAGNDGGGPDGRTFNGAAQSPHVLGVAAYDDTEEAPVLADFSSRGSAVAPFGDPSTWTPHGERQGARRPDLAAPGVGIWSSANLSGGTSSILPRTDPQDIDQEPAFLAYTSMSGTSMATPMVAGAGALLMGACPTAPTLEIMRSLMVGAQTRPVTASDLSRPAEPYETGYGALDVRASYDWLRGRPSCLGNGSGESVRPVLDAAVYSVVKRKNVFDATRTSTTAGNIASYDWDFGDGSRASGASVQHAYRKPGRYEVTLTVRSDGGAQASRRHTISVSRPPSFTAQGHAEHGTALVTVESFSFGGCRTGTFAQGFDGYVFKLPKPIGDENQVGSLQAFAARDLGVQLYVSTFSEDCSGDVISYSESTSHASLDLPQGTRYIIGYVKTGEDVTINLAVHPRIP